MACFIKARSQIEWSINERMKHGLLLPQETLQPVSEKHSAVSNRNLNNFRNKRFNKSEAGTPMKLPHLE